MISITSAPEAPPPRIRILDSRAREVETVRIGDKLTFRIEIPEDSEWGNRYGARYTTREMRGLKRFPQFINPKMRISIIVSRRFDPFFFLKRKPCKTKMKI